VDSAYDILQALKQRLAPTDRARRLQLAQAYHALKKASRAQGTEHWLQQWETTYAEAEKLNLAEIQDHKALYDFIQASKAIDPAYANAYQVYVDTKLEDDANNVPTLYNPVEQFRNNIRTNRAASKLNSHTAYATLQGEAHNSELPADSQSTQPTKLKQHTGCLCGAQHSWSNCPYLIKQLRPPGWVADEQIQKEIDQKLSTHANLREIIKGKRKAADKREEAKTKQKAFSELQGELEQRPAFPSTLTAFAAATNLAIEQKSFPLRKTWILDSRPHSHVCNDRTRFTFERLVNEDDVLIAGKTTYSIKAFGSVIIIIHTPSSPKQITLLNVALASGFFTNTASLNRFTAKGVY
jgi:hypothetical protein